MAFEFMQFGGQRFATARYSHFTGKDCGERMLIFFRNPRHVHEINGREKVLLAVQEIIAATKTDEMPGMWEQLAGTDD